MSRRIFFFALFAIIAAVLLFAPLPIATTYAGRTLENAGHTPLFLVGTLFILAFLRHDFHLEGPRLYALAGIIGSGAGLLSEVIQKLFRRDASWEDVFADAVGAMLAMALHLLFARRARAGRAARGAAVLAVIVGVGAYIAPIVSMARAYLHRDGQFPVLASFDSRVELYWIVGYGVNREIRDGALEVEFDAEEFPGFTFHEPVPDWRRFRTLLVDVENPADQVLHLGLRVHDIGHGNAFADRFNRGFDLQPRQRLTLEIPLEEIQRGPRNRLMNMAQISDVTLYRKRESGSRFLRLHGMRLR